MVVIRSGHYSQVSVSHLKQLPGLLETGCSVSTSRYMYVTAHKVLLTVKNGVSGHCHKALAANYFLLKAPTVQFRMIMVG